MDGLQHLPARAPLKIVRLGHVRLHQLGLHHGRFDGRLRRLLCGRGGGRRLWATLAWTLAISLSSLIVMLATAVVYGLASLGTFVLLRERATPLPDARRVLGTASVTASLGRLAQTWKQAGHYRDLRWLLACCACYQAGISVVGPLSYGLVTWLTGG